MHPNLYNQVIEWIPEKSRVLDLGSGDGSFLLRLMETKSVNGEGVEIDPEMMARCVERGLVMHQGDVMDGLDQYGVGAFDYVLLLGTFEELEHPARVLQEAFRVGAKVIIAYRNICYWQNRYQFLLSGQTPLTEAWPEKWYNSPTVHFFSIKDFHEFFKMMGYKELKASYLNSSGSITFWPNVRAEYGLSLITSQ